MIAADFAGRFRRPISPKPGHPPQHFSCVLSVSQQATYDESYIIEKRRELQEEEREERASMETTYLIKMLCRIGRIGFW